MRWSQEMEEEFIDLEIMRDILEEKRTIKGDFNTGIYIKEKKTDFEWVQVMNGNIGLYLPGGVHKSGHNGRNFIYPGSMGTYEEYSGLDWDFTIEKLEDKLYEDYSVSEIRANTAEDIRTRYEDTVITEIEGFEMNGMAVEAIMAEGVTGEDMEEYAGYVFIIDNGRECCRFYIISKDELWDITYKLGLRILKNMELKEG